MKAILMAAICIVLSGIPSTAMSQRKGDSSLSLSPSATRYFQLTLNLKFGEAGAQPPTEQTITTEVAVRDGRPGSCKARMISQVPTLAGEKLKYVELGTKLDCNDVHIEGNGIALQFTLDTSRIAEMIKTKTSAGEELDEPLITQRTVQLMVQLPLNQTKVVFDSTSHPLTSQTEKSLSSDSQTTRKTQDAPMSIEMTATELK